ncbi:MAG: aromatic acid decarboxylase, partial [Methanocalculaceae archaeon]|nr:aromatic acid decarboxylase [Methanocalculaceae archaeon]
MKRIVVGVTGASGTLYAKRLIEALTKTDGVEVYLIISDTAKTVARLEEVDLSGYPVQYEENCDLSAGIASGSFLFDAMVVIP